MDARPSTTAGGRRAGFAAAAAGCLLALAALSCGKPVDLQQSLEMTDTSSGWHDAGVVAGRNKIVPSVTFRLHKTSPVDVERVSINALFRAADGKESELDNDVYVQRVDFEENGSTPPITLRAENGYTAEPPQSRADMLKHSQFRDMRVQILLKHGSAQWTDLGWIDVKRELILQ
jgi:hypothetical protein